MSTNALLDVEVNSPEELREHLSTLSDAALEHLRQALLPRPRVIDTYDAVHAELIARRQLAREVEQFPDTLKSMADRLKGDEDIEQLSEAEKIALLTYKPDSHAARCLEARTRGLPPPRPPIARRRPGLPQSSPPVRSPGSAATSQPASSKASPAPSLRASNVVSYTGKLFHSRGTGRPTIWHQGE